MSERIVITEDDEDLAFVLREALDEALAKWERRMIFDALQQTHSVQARAAKILGVPERSLGYRIKKLGIQVRTPDDGPSA